MSGTAHSAFLEYARPFQAALHCVSPARLRRTATVAGASEVLRFGNASGIELKRRDPVSNALLESVHLLVDIHFRTLVGSSEQGHRQYRVVGIGYSYAVLTRREREVLVFHWHPGRRSYEHDPHLHVGSAVIDDGAFDFGKSLSRFHIPTGHVPLARVVRMLLAEFNVVPNRQDWDAVLGTLLATEP